MQNLSALKLWDLEAKHLLIKFQLLLQPSKNHLALTDTKQQHTNQNTNVAYFDWLATTLRTASNVWSGLNTDDQVHIAGEFNYSFEYIKPRVCGHRRWVEAQSSAKILYKQRAASVGISSCSWFPMAAAAMEELANRYRESANSYLSRFEPIALVMGPLLALVVARALHSVICVVQDKGIKAVVLGFVMGFVKWVIDYFFPLSYSPVFWV